MALMESLSPGLTSTAHSSGRPVMVIDRFQDWTSAPTRPMPSSAPVWSKSQYRASDTKMFSRSAPRI